jgi:hypothetical protein
MRVTTETDRDSIRLRFHGGGTAFESVRDANILPLCGFQIAE